MRSIGKRNIAKLKIIVIEEMARRQPDDMERIKSRIPEEWYELWEGAYSEIDRLIADFMNDYLNGI